MSPPQTQAPPAPLPGPVLTKAAGRALAAEPAGLQGLARGAPEAGAGQAGVGRTLAHVGAPGGPPPAAQLQALVVHVQQADAAPEADADGRPLQHPVPGWGGSADSPRPKTGWAKGRGQD